MLSLICSDPCIPVSLGVLPLAQLRQCDSLQSFSDILYATVLSTRIPSSLALKSFVDIQNVPNTMPLYLVHDGFGLSTPYRSMISHLNTSLVGINDPYFGLPLAESELKTVQEMAAYYISLLPQDEKEYNILGWSFGGSIAVEMGLQLGKKVRLILVDSFCSASENVEEFDLPPHILSKNHPDGLNSLLLTETSKCTLMGRSYQPEDGRKMAEGSKILLIKASNHPVHTERKIKSGDGGLEHERNGWPEGLGEADWKAVVVDGTHFEMFDEQRVGVVTEAIKEWLG